MSMRTTPSFRPHAALSAALLVLSCTAAARSQAPAPAGFDKAQVPTWSAADLDFFLHGSMGTEVVPEVVLTAFRSTYADLFPGSDLSPFGLIAAAAGAQALPAGLSRREVSYLGGLASLGLNCASCHTTEVRPASGGEPVRLIGTTGHFDAEAFLGAITVAEVRTRDPANMAAFLRNLLRAMDPAGAAAAMPKLDAQLEQQKAAIAEAMAGDPTGGKGVEPGALHALAGSDLR